MTDDAPSNDDWLNDPAPPPKAIEEPAHQTVRPKPKPALKPVQGGLSELGEQLKAAPVAAEPKPKPKAKPKEEDPGPQSANRGEGGSAPPPPRSGGRPKGEIWEHCPVKPLGVNGEISWYLDRHGQLRGVDNHTAQKILHLFGDKIGALCMNFPTFDKEGSRRPNRFDQTAASMAMIAACSERVHMRAGDPVFRREFNRSIHVARATIPPIPGVPLRIGLDQGFKGAAVVAQYLSPRRWRILGELHLPAERLLARVFGDKLRDLIEERWPGWHVEAAWADMAGEHGSSLGAEENETWNRLVGRAAGFNVRPQRLGTNRINPRLEAVRAALEAPLHAGEPGILIDPSCKFLIAGFEARYIWTDEINASGDKRKVPDKSLTEANVMDALQYLLLSEHRANGLSQLSFPEQLQSAQLGHNGGPPLGDLGGLQTGYDILNPYGGLQ